MALAAIGNDRPCPHDGDWLVTWGDEALCAGCRASAAYLLAAKDAEIARLTLALKTARAATARALEGART